MLTMQIIIQQRFTGPNFSLELYTLLNSFQLRFVAPILASAALGECCFSIIKNLFCSCARLNWGTCLGPPSSSSRSQAWLNTGRGPLPAVTCGRFVFGFIIEMVNICSSTRDNFGKLYYNRNLCMCLVQNLVSLYISATSYSTSNNTRFKLLILDRIVQPIQNPQRKVFYVQIQSQFLNSSELGINPLNSPKRSLWKPQMSTLPVNAHYQHCIADLTGIKYS
ncbi:Hypothetical_protein [Hexamita inflata]|uniref:Hypothetical_protein n=1 Tax=Hexamita inflata TaxID=28002 RepID=A0AA86Q8E8_9EUKA|nr:Hypothetical protein HINF_LOCUS34574 [Hexamita inflata]CAI9948092.1 Hypothetical protein HINF_LOCUS35737 [Hexamita inflata]CAI9948120.1 Hypothetical protein HINF_LOCUS35765 [Hexamita inflata]